MRHASWGTVRLVLQCSHRQMSMSFIRRASVSGADRQIGHVGTMSHGSGTEEASIADLTSDSINDCVDPHAERAAPDGPVLAARAQAPCRAGLGPGRFAEGLHRNALVTHLEDLQVLCPARCVKDDAVARSRLQQGTRKW
jgi:hypothetical protein